jgi:hypothetical protein
MTTTEAKQKAIREAYIETFVISGTSNEEAESKWTIISPFIQEDGYCLMYNEQSEKVSPNLQDLGFKHDYDNYLHGGIDPKTNEIKWRPKSLSGIETNNGWISIESEKDLPSDGHYWTINKNGAMNNSPRLTDELCNDTEYWLSTFTHYQPIVKPSKPIY